MPRSFVPTNTNRILLRSGEPIPYRKGCWYLYRPVNPKIRNSRWIIVKAVGEDCKFDVTAERAELGFTIILEIMSTATYVSLKEELEAKKSRSIFQKFLPPRSIERSLICRSMPERPRHGNLT